VLNEHSAERRHARRQTPQCPLVLVVDGDADTRELYGLALPSFGFEINAVDDAADAFMRAWQTHPDAIAIEIARAEDVRWTLIQDLKRDPRTRDIPIVIVTTQSQPVIRERAAREGCAAFLLKPCLPDDLATILRDVLGIESHDRSSTAQ
jgi:CheY-like chemotaxis protein